MLEALRGVAPANSTGDNRRLMRKGVEGEDRKPVPEAVQLQRNDPVGPGAWGQADRRGGLDGLETTWCRPERRLGLRGLLKPFGQA